MCAWFAAAAPYVAAAGTVISADQQRRAGEIDKMNADFEALQLERNANATAAESQREAERARREARFMESRATALAAAGGGSASDPTVVNLIGGIREEGEYNALTALYNGQQGYDSLRTAASMTRQTGKASRSAGRTKAVATALSGASHMARYG